MVANSHKCNAVNKCLPSMLHSVKHIINIYIISYCNGFVLKNKLKLNYAWYLDTTV